MADKLKAKIAEQKDVANRALESIPEGATKTKLNKLMRQASSGQLKPEDAQREINKILKDANKN